MSVSLRCSGSCGREGTQWHTEVVGLCLQSHLFVRPGVTDLNFDVYQVGFRVECGSRHHVELRVNLQPRPRDGGTTSKATHVPLPIRPQVDADRRFDVRVPRHDAAAGRGQGAQEGLRHAGAITQAGRRPQGEGRDSARTHTVAIFQAWRNDLYRGCMSEVSHAPLSVGP